MRARKVSTCLMSLSITLLATPVIACESKLPAINENMTYQQARNTIMSSGWYKNKTSWQEAANLDSRVKGMWDKGYSEVKDCAGTGLGSCLFEFVDAYGSKLTIFTVGQVSKEPENLRISGWKIETKEELEQE